MRRVRSATIPPRTRALLRLFERLRLVREYGAELKLLVRRSRMFTPEIADGVARLAQSNPEEALEAFVSAFQRTHFELDEAVSGEGFESWAQAPTEYIPLLLRGTDRCNGIEPQGFRPGYALQWALIEPVFYGDEREALIAEVAEAFGEDLADRLEAADPPEHRILLRRLVGRHGTIAG